jgi:hypothetical protein
MVRRKPVTTVSLLTQAHTFRDVVSELVVRSGHSTQSDPRTIAEVRRILLLYLKEACAAGIECTEPAAADAAGRKGIGWNSSLSP